MSPLHLEHLLGFKLLCLVMTASPSTARTRWHQLSHRLSCTGRTLTVLAEPLRLATNSQARAASTRQLGHHGQEVSKGTQRSACAGRGAPGVPTWTFHGSATDLAPSYHSHRAGACSNLAKLQRCTVSTDGYVYAAAYRCDARGTWFAVNGSASVTAPHCCAHLPVLTASLTATPGGEGRRGLWRGGDVQPVVLSAPYSPTHMQTKQLSQHHPVLQAEPSPSQKPAKFFMLKNLQTTNHRHKQKTGKKPHQCFFLHFQKWNWASKTKLLAYTIIGVDRIATLSLCVPCIHSVTRAKSLLSFHSQSWPL